MQPVVDWGGPGLQWRYLGLVPVVFSIREAVKPKAGNLMEKLVVHMRGLFMNCFLKSTCDLLTLVSGSADTGFGTSKFRSHVRR